MIDAKTFFLMRRLCNEVLGYNFTPRDKVLSQHLIDDARKINARLDSYTTLGQIAPAEGICMEVLEEAGLLKSAKPEAEVAANPLTQSEIEALPPYEPQESADA